MKIIKRSGQSVEFDPDKIYNAIIKANEQIQVKNKKINKKTIQKITDEIADNYIKSKRIKNVEDIQDSIERKLIENNAYDVAKEFITYRYKRNLVRKSNTTDDIIMSLVESDNEEVKQENSNKNPTIASTQRDYVAGEVSKDLVNRILLPKDIVEAHNAGIIHFHDADYFLQHIFNCFVGHTKFVTDTGIRRFDSFNDGDVTYVLDKDGTLRKATVHKYTKQSMNKVILGYRGGRGGEKEVICTPNHRWILEDGSVTTDLQIGDYLYKPQQNPLDAITINTYEDARIFCLGFMLGDGNDSDKYTVVRLCGKKNSYKDIFNLAQIHEFKNTKNTDDSYYIIKNFSKQDFLNGKGWRYLNGHQKQMLFKGIYSADGSTDRNAFFTSDERIALMIEEISAIAGYHISSKKINIHTTPYKTDAQLTTYRFTVTAKTHYGWYVKDIKPYRNGELKDTWCVEEPVTHSFTLENGVVTGNCCLINLEDMLQNGTVISGTMIEKPHSFSTACNIATQIIAQVASNQYGGQTISLAHLAPFVEVSRQKITKEVTDEMISNHIPATNVDIKNIVNKRLRDEIKRGVQTIQYQVVTLMTTNGQAPFLSVNMYLNEAKNEQEKADLAMVIEEVLKQRIQGVKNEKGVWITIAFPKLLYVLEEDNIHEGDKYWYLTELAARCTAKRMVPDYISEKKMKEYKINKDGNGDCYPCMGCRSFLTPWRTEHDPSKALTVPKAKYYGRFNQGVVTINLVDAGLSAEKNLDKFWEIMEERLNLCHKALRCRHERLKGTLSDTSPIHWQYGAIARLNKGEPIDKLLFDGYSTISLGYAGLWECVYSLIGKKLTEPEGKDLGLKIMKLLNDKCNQWKLEENIDYSVYGTPIESTTYKFAKKLQKRFGIIPGVTDKNYITNSYHVKVTEPINAFDKLSFESEFQKLSPGGAISYVEVPNLQNNNEAVLSVVQFIYNNIMYAELNSKSDYCQVCGYDGEIQIVENESGKLVWECPNCHNRDQSKMNIARRVCGYISTNEFNQGRTQEIKERVVHLGNE